MRKIYTIVCGLILGSVLIANETESLGVITDKDFAQVGVSKENVIKAKEIIKNSKNRYDYLILDRRSKELEINKCILEGVEKNWSKIEELTGQIGKIEAEILKERIKSQYEAQKYINQEQYLKAREIAIRRLEATRQNKNGNLTPTSNGK
ncbi:hypothetical protein [Fusobacterium sp.]|uniref:hypothetical protein n=1 Tax=Fusobacterium sp. TaxID=68766 RepID=UPI002623CB68|nr:hypothetical protein [Fusobacterium sp.]